jgi:hypothetical protein
MRSHLEILKLASQLNQNKILVFEDDAQFIGKSEDLINSISQLSETEWDLFYLGYNCTVPVSRVKPNLAQLFKAYTTHAIAYNSSFFNYAISSIQSGQIQIIDVWLANVVQYRFKCLGAHPMQFSQRPGFSDVENRQVNYDFIVERSVKNVRP